MIPLATLVGRTKRPPFFFTKKPPNFHPFFVRLGGGGVGKFLGGWLEPGGCGKFFGGGVGTKRVFFLVSLGVQYVFFVTSRGIFLYVPA